MWIWLNFIIITPLTLAYIIRTELYVYLYTSARRKNKTKQYHHHRRRRLPSVPVHCHYTISHRMLNLNAFGCFVVVSLLSLFFVIIGKVSGSAVSLPMCVCVEIRCVVFLLFCYDYAPLSMCEPVCKCMQEERIHGTEFTLWRVNST